MMALHTITRCINDDTSFVQESRDIKYRILMNIKFLWFPIVCLVKQLSYLPKNHWILSILSSTKRYQQNVYDRALYAVARPSVRLSVYPSVTRVDQSTRSQAVARI